MLFKLFVATMVVNLKTFVIKPFVMIWVSNCPGSNLEVEE
jgi:hypothetical protein